MRRAKRHFHIDRTGTDYAKQVLHKSDIARPARHGPVITAHRDAVEFCIGNCHRLHQDMPVRRIEQRDFCCAEQRGFERQYMVAIRSRAFCK